MQIDELMLQPNSKIALTPDKSSAKTLVSIRRGKLFLGVPLVCVCDVAYTLAICRQPQQYLTPTVCAECRRCSALSSGVLPSCSCTTVTWRRHRHLASAWCMRCCNDSHDENNQTVSGERKPPPRRLTSTKTDPGFEARSPDLDPEICRIAPRMLWVHYLTLHYLTLHYLDLPRQQWSLLNRFRTEQGHCGACRKKWRLTDTDLCPCGET